MPAARSPPTGPATRPDCLLLQDTGGQAAAGSVGAFGLGQQATDWSPRGLGGVLPGLVNAGMSGQTIGFTAVGGTSSVASWWGDRRQRTDELLARWTELAVFSPLLVTADGDRPGSDVQVWSSPARLQAFATSSRIFAALAQYRRAAVGQAVRDGLPVMRPLWLAEPELSQDQTAQEYLFGGSLLVVPVLESGQRAVEAALPPGTWVDLFTGAQYQAGEPRTESTDDTATATDVARPQRVPIAAPLGRAVVLFRSGDDDGVAARRALAGADLLPPVSTPAGVPTP